MTDYGFIKLHRKLLSWEWMDNPKVLSVFIACLLQANFTKKTWKGIEIPAGSFVTSLSKLSCLTGLSIRQVRGTLDVLKMTRELTIKTTNRYSMISIKNWNQYQINDTQVDKQNVTQTVTQTVTEMTTTKNIKNIRNKEYIEEEESADEILKNWYGSEYKNVHLTDTEYQKLLALTMSEKALNLIIEDFSQRIAERKEENWTPESPQIHYARLKKYWEYRRKHPEKFKNTAAEPQVPFYSPEIED